jgi:3-oxoacyl-[acyl-carrier-protein] synthase-3
MNHSSEIFLTGLTYELGEVVHDLDELTDVVPGVRQTLREGGLETWRTTDRSIVQLASGPLRGTIEALNHAERAGVRRLIFASNSVWDESLHTSAAVSALLEEFGLPQVMPVGANMSWCANFHLALELARLMIETDGDECVLVVCADIWPKERNRLVAPGVSVHSDAAAAFAVSRQGGPFRIGTTRFGLDPRLGTMDRNSQFTQYIGMVGEGLSALMEETLGAAGLARDMVACVVPNNYNRWSCRTLAELGGFTEDDLYLENVPRFAHALCADNPINLCDLASNGSDLNPGDHLLLLGTGPYQWGVSVVDFVRPGVQVEVAAVGVGATGGPPLC